MTESDSELLLEPPLHRALDPAPGPHPLQPVIGHLPCMWSLPKHSKTQLKGNGYAAET